MARVPLYNGGVPTGVPQGSRIPLPSALPAGQGAEAFGQALGKVGNVMGELAQKQQQANDTRQLIEAEGEMRKQAMEFQQFQQTTTDQERWLPAWQERQAGMQKYMDGLKLTDGARLRLTSSFGQWSDNHAADVQGMAFKQAVGRSVDAVKLRAGEGAAAGDYSQIDASFKLLQPGSLTPQKEALWKSDLYKQADEVNRKKIDVQNETDIKNEGPAALPSVRARLEENGHLFDKTERESRLAGADYGAEVQSIEVIAYDDPRRALELAPLKLRGPDRIRVMDTAKARLNELRSASLKDYTFQIQSGVADKDKFAGKIMDDANLEPFDKASLASFLDRGPVNDPITYASLYAEAKNFVGNEGSPEYSQLLSRVDMNLREDQKSSVIATLGDSVKTPKDAQSRAKSAIYSQMSDDLRAGMFGEILGKLDDPKTAIPANMRADIRTIRDNLIANEGKAEAERIAKEPLRLEFWERRAREQWWKGRPDKGDDFQQYAVEDENAKRAASDRAWAAITEVEAYQQQNPRATPQEIKAHYEAQLVRQRASLQLDSAPTMKGAMPGINSLPTRAAPNTVLPSLDAIKKRHATNP
jgi:hypothetical protein